jgi:hypothetical protein
MRKLFTSRTVISLFFFLFMGLALYYALDFGLAARLMPLVVGVPTFLLSFIVLVMELRSQWKEKPITGEGAMDSSRVGKDLGAEEQRIVSRGEFSIVLWLLGLVALIWIAGLLWSIPIFLVLFLWLKGREPWRFILPISVGTWLFVYLLFVQLLRMELSTGLIQNLWGD